MLVVTACRDDSGPLTAFPASPGYLRGTSIESGGLVIFNAETFEVYRTIDLPHAPLDYSHRLERDDRGRVWIGYHLHHLRFSSILSYLPFLPKAGVLVFAAQGELEHALDVDCGAPDAGIAFSNGYAFVGCDWAGSNVAVIDMDTMGTVKILEDVGPERRADGSSMWIDLVGVEEVAGVVLLLGMGFLPGTMKE